VLVLGVYGLLGLGFAPSAGTWRKISVFEACRIDFGASGRYHTKVCCCCRLSAAAYLLRV
jgi:hypothetical protein